MIHLRRLTSVLPCRAFGLSLALSAVLLIGLGRPSAAQEERQAAAASVAGSQEADDIADDRGVLYQRFKVAAGGFAAFFSTNLRLDSEELGIGTEISLEDDLGFTSNKFDFRGFGYYRFGKRHKIKFGYFSLSRNSRKVLDEEIQFGDETFDVDTEIEANFRSGIPSLGYNFSFVARPKVEAWAGIGLSAMFTKTGIEAVGSVDDEPVNGVSETEDVTLPIATFGLGVAWNPVASLILGGSFGGLYVKISDIEAGIGEAVLSAEYYIFRNLGLGAAFNWVKLGAKNTGGNTFDVTYRYSGFLIYLAGVFF
jgi:hypothetical protein